MLLTDTPPPENMTAKGHENHTGIGHFESIQKRRKKNMIGLQKPMNQSM